MFGEDAPIWEFPIRFGGPNHPLEPVGSSLAIETYPVLTMIALGWMLPDMRATGRLPKYNPERRGTFAIEDWRYVCRRTSHEFRERCINGIALW